MTRRFLLVSLLALVLAACEQANPLEFDTDRAPEVWIGAINGNDGRHPPGGVLYAPAGNMVDPATGSGSPYPVFVEITASDERAVDSIELRIDGTTFDTLTPNEDAAEFRNPFVFVVPLSGNASGLVETQLSVVVTDSSGQTNEAHAQTIQVDGSFPLLSFTPPTGDQTDQIVLSGSVSDPESGIKAFTAFLNFSEIASLETDGTAFVVPLDTTSIPDGEHIISFVATNGANASLAKSWFFTVKNEPDPAPAP